MMINNLSVVDMMQALCACIAALAFYTVYRRVRE